MSEEIKFVGKISTMGKDKILISIPRNYWNDIEHLKGKHVKVIVSNALD